MTITKLIKDANKLVKIAEKNENGENLSASFHLTQSEAIQSAAEQFVFDYCAFLADSSEYEGKNFISQGTAFSEMKLAVSNSFVVLSYHKETKQTKASLLDHVVALNLAAAEHIEAAQD